MGTLLVLAAGMGSRYGGLKQLDGVGPSGEVVLDYSLYDALRAGFKKVVFVVRDEFAAAFRKRCEELFADKIEVELVCQRLDDLPEGFALPEGREKPWGTAHAIRAARSVIDGPFCAINADDFYGKEAFVQMFEWLQQVDHEQKESLRISLIGYVLANTLSEHGGVSRGICRVAGGQLLGVEEKTKIRAHDGAIYNEPEGRSREQLAADALVSMNFWGFGSGFFAAMEAQFTEFLRTQGQQLKSEWYIPFVVDELIEQGLAEVDVLATESRWFGVTYREDREQVVRELQALVAEGQYPQRLF